MFKLNIVALCFVAWVSRCSGDDVVVQMFSKKPINYISEKYISYSIDPNELLEMSQEREDGFIYRMMESGPCYLKIYGNYTNKMQLAGNFIDLNSSKLSLERLKDVYDILRIAGIKPVIALPYDPNNWNTRNVMRILGKVSLLEMNDITWQLGANFHAKDAVSYIDDLNTLKLIVGAFATKESKKNWSVVGSDITVGSSEDEARMYSELSKYIVDAVGWSQSIELSYSDENVDDFFSSMNVDPALRTILNGESPIWLSLLQKNTDVKNPLTHMKQGLNWAQILGDAAKNGFKVIYTPIDKQTWYEPTMSYYTTLLHKRIIGQTVFDTKMFNGNRFDSHFYAHCTKNMSGSFTLYGVNGADSSLDITAKLPFRSGTAYLEFILTVGVNGKVYLNGAEIIEPTVLTPLVKYKLPGKGAMLSMPAHSVAFWVFTAANIPECESVAPISFDFEQSEERTSSEHLLQQLIVETVDNDEQTSANEENSISRSKRSTNIEKDGVSNRIRRNTENSIGKQSEYNAIEMNDETQERDKRYVGVSNFIYNNIDDMKRRSIFAPYKSKLELPAKRTKRDILRNLFDKFDLKKTAFNFKTPTLGSLKLGNIGLLPSISTVHDVLNPSNSNNKEQKLFDRIENPELPNGDVHFELAEVVTEPNEYAAALNAANRIVEKPNTFMPYNNYATPVAMQNQNSVPMVGELTEMAAKSEIVTAAPAIRAQAAQAQRPQAVQHQLQYVVKDLPPTWQMNRDNMEKTRNNLRQNLWPMANVQQLGAKPINAFLPNVAMQGVQQPAEHIFFESRRRRRRAIDSRMNDEIEQRIQRNELKNELRLDESVDQIELVDKMQRMFDKFERSQNGVFKIGKGGLKGLLSARKSDESDNKIKKKCKVLSMAMEQQCLQTENQPSKTLFKRSLDIARTSNGPFKKLFSRLKDSVDGPLKFRIRRSIDENEINENDINAIFKEPKNEEEKMQFEKNVLYDTEKRRNEWKRIVAKKISSLNPSEPSDPAMPTTTQSTAPETTPAEAAKPADGESTKNAKNVVPEILRTMRGYVSEITKTVAKSIGKIWFNLA
ncbi:uncharacterized protein LOC116347073 [Contarinia nasturtii]|uniref:uncharacterized protein LOC116347073 n=1 Tax=Contarinia nasturtii TaxID=265458 RepID=UPI0012D39337|nr:uncharacterized protein LOC116347073 [Contarinia nasturtii]